MPLTTGMLLAMLKKQETRIKILEDKVNTATAASLEEVRDNTGTIR